MAMNETPTPAHWGYFLALEDDVIRMSRYLEPAKENFGSYSLELARMLFAAASEVDVIAKCICKKLAPESNAENIKHYEKEILAAYPQITSAVVEIPRFNMSFTPWADWGKQSPSWWRAYNNVKHSRHAYFNQASLEHTLNAIAGLFIFLLFYYREEGESGELCPDPLIFRVGPPFDVDQRMWGARTNVYKLRVDDGI